MDKKEFKELEEMQKEVQTVLDHEYSPEDLEMPDWVKERIEKMKSSPKTATEVLIEEATEAHRKKTKELIRKTLELQVVITNLTTNLLDRLDALNIEKIEPE